MFKSVSSQPDFAAQEEEVLQFWQAQKIFEKSVEQNREKPLYVIYDGPPYANARPPLHTIVPMSFKDLVGRYKTMRGYQVPRQAGWDTHGLPIEVQVEKKLGLADKKAILNLVPGDEVASIREFNRICRESVFAFKQEWDQFVPRVGYWTDLEHPYITYEPEYIEKTWGVFKQIWDKGLVYKGYKVVPYCPRCGTVLSSAEVAQEYQDVKDTSVYVTFPLVDKPERAFLAWTTTPWTLPGNVALAVGEAIEYVVVKQESGEYILAKSRLEVLQGDYEILEEIKGEDLVDIRYQPLFPGIIEGAHYVVPADFVSTEDGTGIVHTAVMYGEDDFNLGKQFKLPMQHTVGLDGRFLDNVPQFAGQNVREALGPILTELQNHSRLYKKEVITHSYPFCWRCKTALIYYAKDSWFIAMSKLRDQLVQNNREIEWFPAAYKEGRFGEFIKEARDWAVSRERFWGIPMPVWVSESGKILCIGSLAELKQYTQLPEDFDPHRPQVDDIIVVKDGEEYRREPHVLDIWFDSGAVPYASGRKELGLFPADYIAEATDQTRGWFYHLLAISTILDGTSSFKRVVCMGLLMDDQGKKMSKSGGNVLDPWETFKICGVDAIRWFLYSVNAAGETKNFGVKELQSSFRRSLLLLWNVFNYFVTYANVAGVEAPRSEQLNELENLTKLDEWILSEQAQLINQVTTYLDQYDFLRVTRTIEAYITDLSTWYLRRSRKRSDSTFFYILYDLLYNLSLLMAPCTPFLSEQIYQVLRRPTDPESVHLHAWPEVRGSFNRELHEQMQLVRQAVELGLAIRAEEKIKVRQPLAEVYIQSDKIIPPELFYILQEELNVEQARVSSGPITGFPSKSVEGLAVALDTKLTDALIKAGLTRELLRQIQNLRKERGLKPGEKVTLQIDPNQKGLVEPLLTEQLLKDTYVTGPNWQAGATAEISLNNETVFIDLVT